MLYLGDCLEIIQTIDKKIDLVMVDLPYGQTANKWDICIDLKQMWIELKKICKNTCNYVFFTTTKFGNLLINSNPVWFRYDLVWEKSIGGGYLDAKLKPLRTHEMIYIFGNMDAKYSQNTDLRNYFKSTLNYINRPPKEIRELFAQKSGNHCWYFETTQFALPSEKNYNQLIQEYKIDKMPNFITYDLLKHAKTLENNNKAVKTYNPQMTIGKPYKSSGSGTNKNYGTHKKTVGHDNTGTRYPKSVLKFNNECKTIHPTQKPIELCKYLVLTYSNEMDYVLDFTMGSGSTGMACRLTNRQFIGIEKDAEIYYSAVNRLW